MLYVTLEKKRSKTQSFSVVDSSDHFSVFSKQLEELRECVAKLIVGNFFYDCVEETAVATTMIHYLLLMYLTLVIGVDLVTGIKEKGEQILEKVPRREHNSPRQFNVKNQNGGYVDYR